MSGLKFYSDDVCTLNTFMLVHIWLTSVFALDLCIKLLSEPHSLIVHEHFTHQQVHRSPATSNILFESLHLAVHGCDDVCCALETRVYVGTYLWLRKIWQQLIADDLCFRIGSVRASIWENPHSYSYSLCASTSHQRAGKFPATWSILFESLRLASYV